MEKASRLCFEALSTTRSVFSGTGRNSTVSAKSVTEMMDPESPLVQGKEQWLRFAGAAVKR